MYAIANVIYGVPLTRGYLAELADDMNNEGVQDSNDGYLKYYSGNSDYVPAAFGVELCSFDEATDYLEVEKLKLEPTDEDKKEFNRLLLELDEPFRNIIERETPSVFILWSTS